MPELPEVETVKLGLRPHLLGQKICQVRCVQPKLRYPVPDDLSEKLQGLTLKAIERRAKYLLMTFVNEERQTEPHSVLVFHLGMTGNLRVLPLQTPLTKHDHVQFELENGQELRYYDVRRFGFILLFSADNPPDFLQKLGVEPLNEEFNADFWQKTLQNKKTPIKVALMNGALVVGIGNIYANESLFYAKISPLRAAGSLTSAEIRRLVLEIKAILRLAIEAGGSTLKDFVNADGHRGYFQQSYSVYGRKGEACKVCKHDIVAVIQAQRRTFYCPICQC
ncbi:MAG: bifunctional DNA-formamidopyrimidine glycosylase/DNA-(apurinic or apyrimidinic site) lyase [Neisseriaceae bacterium]|nr:bifunctional DNA-formamidopyrimidine glycosylase/DNA-(apurinic or apyrimidinic site) lyase [Neisseriaceae bacterium]